MSEDELERLRVQVEAERAGSEHWRRVARHHEGELRDLKARPSVRVLVALDRRTARLRTALRIRSRGLRQTADRSVVTVNALRSRGDLSRRQEAIDEIATRGADPAVDRRSLLLIVVAHPSERPLDPPGQWLTPGDDRGVTTVTVDPTQATAGVNEAVARHPLDLIAIVSADAEPVGRGELTRLINAVAGTIDATRPVLVHPSRQGSAATEHDLLVRSTAVAVERTSAGGPRLVAEGAGSDPTPIVGLVPTVAVSSVASVFDRTAFERAGRLAPLPDLDHALVEIGTRLSSSTVTDAFVFDHRPVVTRSELTAPLPPNSEAWTRLVSRAGPAMLRTSMPGDAPTTFTITVASPSAKVARHWGDWHLAEGLARALDRLGHDAVVQPLSEVDTAASRSRDVHLVLRGLARVKRTPGQRHVIWVISHPEDLDDGECDDADLILVASESFAVELRRRTSTRVEVMLQATDQNRFRPLPVDPTHDHAVTIVGRSRDVLRPMVADALAGGIRPAVYGTGWDGLIDDELIVAREVPNEDLPTIYSSARVVLNDHWDTMRRWGFVSNRIFDVAACGTPVISDPLPELTEMFGGLVATWTTPEELVQALARIVDDPEGSRQRADALRGLVLARHTFDHRALEILAHLDETGVAR